VARGAGRYSLDRIPYVVELAVNVLKDFRHIILVEANEPVAFFAYPNKPSLLKADEAKVHKLCDIGGDSIGTLQALADGVGAKPADVKPQKHPEIVKPTGALTHASIAAAIAAAIPENAIVVDEAVTTGRAFFGPTAGARPHDWLQNMGGSIGYGTPVATGAAVACPDRRVIALEGDGSAMYTIQSLWTQAREQLDVTTVIFANQTYEILKGEFANVQAGTPGKKAVDMLNLDRPSIDWVAMARSMGVPGVAVSNAEDFHKELTNSVAAPGPRLIEVQM
jgi:acetolactate synthase-1/2/3 large subunit